jgi:hypothetical protein
MLVKVKSIQGKWYWTACTTKTNHNPWRFSIRKWAKSKIIIAKKEAISQEEYDLARADLKSAQAQSQLIRAQIAKNSGKSTFLVE